jgi:copper transport outer membrane protein MctB
VIDFRYHLVSIVAVFLALGLGLVLGSTALRPYVLAGLEKTSRFEHNQIDSLLATQHQLKLQISADQEFAQAGSGLLLDNLLSGQRVVIVAAPGAPSQVASGVRQDLIQAGATVIGEVQLQPTMFDASSGTQAKLSVLAQRFTPPGTTLRPGTPFAQASQVLAGAILTRDRPGQPVAGQRDAASAAVLAGFAAEGFLTRSGQPATRATLSVVIQPAAPAVASDSNPASQALVTLAQQLNQAGLGTVVAGSITGSGAGSAVDVMRNGRAGQMSSVDDADYAIGQIVVVQALAEQLTGGSGNYGVTSSASGGAGPSPAPSASPSATARATATRAAHPHPHPSASASRTP